MKLGQSAKVSILCSIDLHRADVSGCKKGGRECEFPASTSSAKRSKGGEPRSPQDIVKQESNESKLDSIKDEDEPEEDLPKSSSRRPTINARTHSAASTKDRKQKYRTAHSQDRSPTLKERPSPISTSSSSTHSSENTPTSSVPPSSAARSAEVQARQAKIKTLSPAIQKYLQFQLSHMTHYHYFFKLDPTDFIHNEFIDQALSFEPLLYAAVGFAAYHYELQQPQPSLSNFLTYYSKSLVLLRRSLEKHQQSTEAMLLTVLQLATIEEYLGDWVNLVGHHRAGFTMLTSIYTTPPTMMETDLGRRLFSWYARLDVIAGIMGGSPTRLSRPWFEANAAYYAAAVDTDPENDLDIEGMLAAFVATNRLLGFDMATLFARLPRNEITPSEFQTENAKIADRLREMKSRIETLNDSFYTVSDYPVAVKRPLKPDEDIVDPYVPGGLFKDALWNLNFMWIDWYAIEQMQKYQSSILQQKAPPPELAAISLQQCRIYESIDRYPDAPEGAILGAHASLGLATVFLKKDEKHIMWARRKLADIEKLGYIFPVKFRLQMAQLWGLSKAQVGEEESVEDWWLPNGEGHSEVLKEIRKIVDERHAGGKGEEILKMEGLSDVRDLKAIFARLDLRTQGAGGAALSKVESDSPASEATKSFGSAGTTAINSPSSATSTGVGSFGPPGDESWGGGQLSQVSSRASQGRRGSDSTVKGKGKDAEKVRKRERKPDRKEEDRMSWIGAT